MHSLLSNLQKECVGWFETELAGPPNEPRLMIRTPEGWRLDVCAIYTPETNTLNMGFRMVETDEAALEAAGVPRLIERMLNDVYAWET